MVLLSSFFFFNDTATTEIYTLSLHDALPIVNVDFADVRTVMQNGGAAIMGTGMGRGENRAMEAGPQAISSPPLDNISITGATRVALHIHGRRDPTPGQGTPVSDVP